MTMRDHPLPFFGWRVVAASFVMATFGWGVGFYGPPIFLHAVHAERGWSLPTVSAAVTVHFLVGAGVVAGLPALHRRFGLSRVTTAGAIALALGVLGWSLARDPWQLFLATLFSGGGWVTMGAAAVNATVAPWFVADRPKALSAAYNGASVGGILFAPLWVASIATLGFPLAAALIGAAMVAVIGILAARVFAIRPADLGQSPDERAAGSGPTTAGPTGLGPVPAPLARRPWSDGRFLTLSAGMALGLFAQIGLLAHLFSLIVPALGVQGAGLAMSLATGAAIAGRTAFGWLMAAGADRRRVAAASYLVQLAGSLVLLVAGTQEAALVLAGIVLFGFGIGNATSLPPLIAQAEFARDDVARVVALIVAVGQAGYAFAPAAFGALRALPEPAGDGTAVFAATAAIQALAIAVFLAGSRRQPVRLSAQMP
ncbi:MAG TPA: MFS transporter [Kaistia sp.]|nr:MFS transporter [Kaistia sp.]